MELGRTINLITENNSLEPGKYYHCFHRTSGHHSIEMCGINEGVKFIAQRCWADDSNSQAIPKWAIFGPIEIPRIMGPMYCEEHYGYGFKSDCIKCNVD